MSSADPLVIQAVGPSSETHVIEVEEAASSKGKGKGILRSGDVIW